MIELNNGSISVEFEGKIKQTPTKRGHVSSTSIYGEELSEYTRGVINLSITIEYISESEYQNLIDLFFDYNDSIDVEDKSRGNLFKNYYITGDSISLTEAEDLINKVYYYTGSITMNRR